MATPWGCLRTAGPLLSALAKLEAGFPEIEGKSTAIHGYLGRFSHWWLKMEQAFC
jgi:hypothetical protein